MKKFFVLAAVLMLSLAGAAEKGKKYVFSEDFSSGKILGVWKSGGDKGGQIVKIDTKVFVSGGKSLYYKNVAGQKISAGYTIKDLKPSTRYRLTYSLKTNKLAGTKGGAGLFIYFNKTAGAAFPGKAILGTHPWSQKKFEFKTPAKTGEGRDPILGIWIWLAPGEAWFDDIRIEEIR